MNGRIFVLLAATGLFVHVWNANHRLTTDEAAGVSEIVPATSLTIPRVELTLELPPADEFIRHETVPVLVVSAEANLEPDDDLPFERRFEPIVRSQATPSVAPVWIEPSLLPERLPQGIAAGLYQVVDNFGHVTLAQITSERLVEAGIVAENTVRDVYMQQSGNQRWYFIRQGELCESKPTIAPTRTSPQLLTETVPALPASTTDVKKQVPPTTEMTSLSMRFNKNRMMTLQRERMLELTADKLNSARITVVAAVPSSARNFMATGWKYIEHTAKRMADRMIQQFPPTERVVWGIDWLTPKSDVQELPAVTVPELEVELPSIPLQTVCETRSEETSR